MGLLDIRLNNDKHHHESDSGQETSVIHSGKSFDFSFFCHGNILLCGFDYLFYTEEAIDGKNICEDRSENEPRDH
jgi:hypothetical protein